MLTIVPYESHFAENFKELNLAWINAYFVVEEKDIELLENCESSIIDKGGFIFIGLWDKVPVSCYALLRKSPSAYELSKMAVNKPHQGLQIGQQMLGHAIEFGRKQKWNSIHLYSSTKLDTALYIYKKFGFKEVALEKNLNYLRSDIKMELIL